MTNGSEETIEVSDLADEESIFLAARRLIGREQQQLFLEQTCGADAGKCQRILALLSVEQNDPSFLQKPAARSGLTVLFLRDDLREGHEIGPYRLLRPLGAGGMGVVWLAEQRSPVYRRLALKLIKNGFGTETDLRLFDSERQILAILDHPGIVKLLDAGETQEGRPWYAMEHVTGQKITDYCIQRNLSLENRLELFISVCDAIDHAHQRGVVHCDLKPANILITESLGISRSRLIDFGVARAPRLESSLQTQSAADSSRTEGSQLSDPEGIQGTLAYMSPEQAAGTMPIDCRSDVYSMGAVLYELIGESAPLSGAEWEQSNVHTRLQMIRDIIPIPVRQRLARRDQTTDSGRIVPGQQHPGLLRTLEKSVLVQDVDRILQKALKKDRDMRYASMRQLANDLQLSLRHQPLSVGHGNARHQCLKFMLRHRSAFALSGVLALCVLIAGIAGRTFALQNRSDINIEELPQATTSASLNDYVDEVQAAHLYAFQGQVEQLRTMLPRLEKLSMATQVTDGAASTSNRRFELEYLKELATLELLRIQPHRGKVFAVAFSPDGTRAASGSGDSHSELLIQDVVTGAVQTRFPVLSNDVNSICFSRDGQWIVTAEESALIRGWDISGELARETFRLEGFEWAPGQIWLSPDGNSLIATEIEWKSMRCRMSVWDIPTRTRRSTFNGFRALGVCEPGDRLVVVSETQQLQLWTLHDFQLERTCEALVPYLTCGDVFNSMMTAAGNRQGDVWLWNLNTSTANVLRVDGTGNHPVRDVTFSGDGHLLMAAYNDGTIRVWDTSSRMMISCVKSKSNESWSLDISRDSRLVVAGFGDGFVEILKTEEMISGFQRQLRNVPHITGAAFSSDGEFAFIPHASGLAVDVVRLSDLQTVRTVTIKDASPDESLHYSSHVRLTDEIALTSTRGRIFVAPKNASIATLRVDPGIDARTRPPVFSDDGTLCSTAPNAPVPLEKNGGGIGSIWNLQNGMLEWQLPSMDPHAVHQPHQVVAFEGAEEFVSFHGWDVSIWKPNKGMRKELDKPFIGLRRPQLVTHVAKLPRPNHFLIATSDDTIHLWDPASSSEKLRLLAHGIRVQSTAVSPDGHTLAIGSPDGQIQLRNLPSGKLLFPLAGGAGGVFQLQFSRDGQRLYALREVSSGSGELLSWGNVPTENSSSK